MKRSALTLAALLLAIATPAQAGNRSATVTAYCACAKCCGEANQPTASGRMPAAGVTVAGPRSVPLGTRVFIEGVGERIVQDRTAMRYDGRFDIFMRDHRTAQQFGKRKLRIRILP